MDAREFFAEVAAKNYQAFHYNQQSVSAMWNAVVSLNTVPEWLALEKLNYLEVHRDDLDRKSNEIRKQYSELDALADCANTLKHVRRLKGAQTVITKSSTGIDSRNPDTWVISDKTSGVTHNLASVCDAAYRCLCQIPELNN